MVEYYDVLYDYYGEGDAELALVLSVFSVIIGALTWLRKVQSSFLSLSLFFFFLIVFIRDLSKIMSSTKLVDTVLLLWRFSPSTPFGKDFFN